MSDITIAVEPPPIITIEVNASGPPGPPGPPGEAGLGPEDILAGTNVTVTRTATTATISATGGGTGDHGALTGLSDDDHPQYQLSAQKGAANGYAPLGADSKVPSANLPTASAGVTDHGALTGLSDPDHPIAAVSGLQAALDLKAPLASPALTGNPTAPTPTAGDNDTSIATTAFVTAVAVTKWTMWTGTQAAYDAIVTKDSGTLYVVVG